MADTEALAAATRRRQWRGRALAYAALSLGVLVFAFPIWMTLVGSTHDVGSLGRGDVPLWFGPHGVENYHSAWTTGGAGTRNTFTVPASSMLFNSALMALLIALGKIAISLLSAYAVVFFAFPGRMLAFWLIFITLMLPVEVRIIPTFEVMVNMNLTNSMAGLTVPLMNIAALFVILFIYGWNQYLWPLLMVNDRTLETIVVGLTKMIGTGDSQNEWNTIMATAMMALLPPVLVVVLMQRWFIKGLTETEK